MNTKKVQTEEPVKKYSTLKEVIEKVWDKKTLTLKESAQRILKNNAEYEQKYKLQIKLHKQELERIAFLKNFTGTEQ